MMEKNTLQWVDYLVIAAMLCISIGIGIYYRFNGGRQKTVEEYFVANRSMSIVPVAIAMMASFMAGSGLLGLSAENYVYGTQLMVINVSHLLAIPIICYEFLPVFYKLQATSAYEYLEKRFGKRARMTASFMYGIQHLFYSGLALYAPSAALETTTGISVTCSVIIIGVICAFYSSIGGIKAVLATDVFQGLLMFAAVFIVIGTAANNVGGLGQIWEIARHGQRLEFDSIDLDPTVRHTWWSLTFGGLCTFLILVGVNQVQIQRMLAVKNMQASRKALWLFGFILAFLYLSICFSGLAVYSRYYNCDPFLKKRIISSDMLIPLYIMDTISNMPGLPGLFAAGIFSASLSTISASQNSMSAIMLEDYVKPLYRKYFGHELSPSKSASIAKMLAFTFGILSVVLALLVPFLSGMTQAVYTIFGVIGGPLLGMFILGMGTESATEGGAIIGTITALSFLFWISLGQPRPIAPKLPTTIDGCDNNIANITVPILQNVTNVSKSTGDSSYFYLYRISYMWYSPIGLLITFSLGLFVSNLSRLFIKNQNDEIDIKLFFPIVARRIRYRRRNNTEYGGSSQLDRRYTLSDVIHRKDNATDKICIKF